MKMLMQNDQPEETIQRPMEDPAMVQSGVRKDQILYFVGPVIFAPCQLFARRMCDQPEQEQYDLSRGEPRWTL